MKPNPKFLFSTMGLLAALMFGPANATPVAIITAPTQVYAGETFNLDGTHSYDTLGSSISFGWDLNADGVYTDSTLSMPAYTVAANAILGTSYTVLLRVTNSLGERATTGTSFTVVEKPVAAVPEPVSMGLIGLGLAALAATRRTRVTS